MPLGKLAMQARAVRRCGGANKATALTKTRQPWRVQSHLGVANVRRPNGRNIATAAKFTVNLRYCKDSNGKLIYTTNVEPLSNPAGATSATSHPTGLITFHDYELLRTKVRQ